MKPNGDPVFAYALLCIGVFVLITIGSIVLLRADGLSKRRTLRRSDASTRVIRAIAFFVGLATVMSGLVIGVPEYLELWPALLALCILFAVALSFAFSMFERRP